MKTDTLTENGIAAIQALAHSPKLDTYASALEAFSREVLVELGRSDLAEHPFYRGCVIGALQSRQDQIMSQAAQAITLGHEAFHAATEYDSVPADGASPSEPSGLVDEADDESGVVAQKPSRHRPQRGRRGRG